MGVEWEKKACSDCAIAKARQKNLNKVWSSGSKVPGERLFVDISSIRGESYGGTKFWVLVLDDCTDYCWSFFLRNKSDLKYKVVNVIKELNGMDKKVSFVRCDDAGENKSFEQLCKNLGQGVQFEYSGPRNPQRNDRLNRSYNAFWVSKGHVEWFRS